MSFSKSQMSLSVVEPVQDVIIDAEEEVMQMLESALGPMTALLDRKFKQKMSQHALMKIIKGVVELSLQTVDAYTPENEKKVLAALEDGGFSGKKEKRAGKLSGYTLFTKQMHQDKKEEFKSRGIKGSDVTKEIGAMWKKLSDDDKQEYNDKAKKENEENPSSSRKVSKKGSDKGSRKSDKETHKCCFVISKGDRKGETCGTSVRSDEPTFEGQWLCSKHATAEKKKVESNKNKKEKGSNKKEKKEKKDEEEVEEKKSDKKAKKVEKDDEEEKKSEKKKVKKIEEEKSVKKVKKIEEEKKSDKKAKKIEKEEVDEIDEIDEIEDLDEVDEEDKYQILDSMCLQWEEDIENGTVNAKISKSSLEKLICKKLSGKEYDIKISATKSSLIVKYEEDDEEEMKAIKKDKMSDDLKKVHEYISSLDE